jgi:hypothetical protein
MEVGHSLTDPSGANGDPLECDYPQLVGALMYLMVCTRPDIAYAVSVLSRFMAPDRHTSAHWKAAKRVLAYLKKTKHLSLVLGRTQALEITAYSDAAYADDQEQRKSTLGYHISLGTGLVSWKAKLSDCVALSSAESEYYAGCETVKEAEWLAGLVRELGWEVPPYKVLMDSQSARAIIKNSVINARSKHIEVKHHFIRQMHAEKKFVLKEVSSAANLADYFTKALPEERLRALTKESLQPVPAQLKAK